MSNSPADLLKSLRRLWRDRRESVDSQYSRTLPFADYIVDRWEKAQLLGFGEKTSIYDSALVLGEVVVGNNTWIGPGAILDGSGGLAIGSFCSIGAGAHIYSHDSVAWAISGGLEPYEYAPTRIGDRCFIGPKAIITKGVTVGDGCVIGAASVVFHDVPAGARVAGAPARKLD